MLECFGYLNPSYKWAGVVVAFVDSLFINAHAVLKVRWLIKK